MDYFKHPGISNTKLGWFKKSPAHFKYFQDNPQPEREAFVIGDASHTILFQPEDFKKRFYVLDTSKRPVPDSDFKNSKNRIWKQEMEEAYSHKIIIDINKYDAIMFMMEAMKRNEYAQELIQDCEFEKEHYWTEPTTGLQCKKKVDGENSTHRIDYKTTDNADPYKWQRKTWSYEYYRQAGFYDIDKPKEFYFIVQEKEAPYLVSVHKCTPDLINYGKDEAMLLLRKIKACIDNIPSGEPWPGYEIKTFKPEMPELDQRFFDYELPSWVIQGM
jgi:hypothetical protein